MMNELNDDAEVEAEIIRRVADHWFIQGGQAQFGPLETPQNADEVISQILALVRKQLPPV